MNTTNLAVLVLTWMFRMASAESPSPWVDSYGETAVAIAEQSDARPLPGASVRQTAAVLTVWGWREARFNPAAVHDHGLGLGLFGTHHATLGRQVPSWPEGQAEAALELMATSFRICSKHPLEERMSWYSAGGVGCEKRNALSRSRMREAAQLFRALPVEELARLPPAQ
jgi:hypothetical protein